MDIYEWIGIEKEENSLDNIINIDSIFLQTINISDNIAHCINLSNGEDVYIAKQDSIWALGKTERAAQLMLKRKIFYSKSVDEHILDFVNKFSADEIHTTDEWIKIHHEYMGSCGIGAYQFIKQNNIKRYNKYTTLQFLDIVDGAYGGDIVSKIKQYYHSLEG